MEGQMSIFDFLEPELTDFLKMTEAEIAEYIGDQLGLKFVYNNHLERYECNVKKNYKLDLEVLTYWTSDYRNGKKFISAGHQLTTGSYRGGGKPCDSLDEAVKYLREQLTRFKNGEIK